MVLPSEALFLISRNRASVIYRQHRCSYGRFVMFVSYKKVYTAPDAITHGEEDICLK